MQNQFSTDQIELVDLMSRVESGEIQLPNFQRGYNWKTTAVLKLLDSIHKGHPAGSLLFLETTEPALIGFEPIRTVDKIDLEFPKHLVLDGQQRMTSCHSVFFNKGRNSYFIDLWQLFYNYSEEYEEIDLLDNKIIIAKKNHPNPEDYLFSSDLLAFNLLQNKREFRSRIYDYKESLRNNPDTDSKFLKFVEQHLENFIEPFFDYEFPVVILPKTLTIEGVCKVFQSINTTGLKLSAFDICVATFMPCQINLKELLDDALDENDRIESIIESDKTILLQVIALLSGVSPKKNNLPKTLLPAFITDEWNNAVAGLNSAVKVFDQIGVGLSESNEIIPYQPMIPVLAATLVKKEYENQPVDVKAKMVQKIAKWFFKSALEMRYTEGTDNKMLSDFIMLREWLSSEETPKHITNPLYWSMSTISNANKNGAFGKAILTVLNSHDLEDFYTDEKVGIKAGLSSKSHLHHIFPKAAFNDVKNINSVFNFTYLTAETNRFIKDSKPSEYIPAIAEDLDVMESVVAKKLESHLIDSTCLQHLKSDNYQGFINTRILLVSNYLNNTIGLNIQITDESLETEFDNDDNFIQEFN